MDDSTKEIKEKAYAAMDEYFEKVHAPKFKFIPGKTKISHAGKVFDASEMKNLVDATMDFWLTEGKYSFQFEKKLNKFLGVKETILTNSGSSANLLAISALTSPDLGERQLKPGDEVLTVACSFPTTVNPIVQNKLIPVFIDVDIETLNAQPELIEKAISSKTKAIILAHTMGNPFDCAEVLRVAKKHNLWVIEDNCDALGSKYDGNYTGTIGDVGTLSFYPAHPITMGEGGALTTNNEELAKIIRSFRDWGRHCWCKTGCDNTCGTRFAWQLGQLPMGYDHKFIYNHIGYNLKVTDFQAAIGVAQMDKLEGFIKIRRNNFNKLYAGLKKFEEYFILPKSLPKAETSWYGFYLTLKDNCGFNRTEIVTYLDKNKIGTRLIFAGNLIKQPSFKGVEHRVYGTLENTDRVMNNTFWFGCHQGVNDEICDYILDTISKFIAEKGKKS